MKLNAYLAFDGKCREAFEFYQKSLGGNIAFIQSYGESPMPFQPTFWAKGFGMLIDRFGTPWMVNAGQMIS